MDSTKKNAGDVARDNEAITEKNKTLQGDLEAMMASLMRQEAADKKVPEMSDEEFLSAITEMQSHAASIVAQKKARGHDDGQGRSGNEKAHTSESSHALRPRTAGSWLDPRLMLMVGETQMRKHQEELDHIREVTEGIKIVRRRRN
ncbi:hypothetical protein CMEL01_16770 [Colletotrichum melonis]|uniref:Uncharacterized protein n=1 Tax=Colletotrichum melonis TaxID=1209925 RepID=A0AAI9XK83_9PEZI|nr:hypothetical protein CMEL01_16770 [Colletotrichum melonis]